MGVRKGDEAYAGKLQSSIERNQQQIKDILAAYNIPLIQHIEGTTQTRLESTDRAVSKI